VGVCLLFVEEVAFEAAGSVEAAWAAVDAILEEAYLAWDFDFVDCVCVCVCGRGKKGGLL